LAAPGIVSQPCTPVLRHLSVVVESVARESVRRE
jgi:hypothetical protein